ncbi:MAG TPA: hypothetical protein VG297_23145 [Bryobacteraceae bacterium]|nr:hypothetical protein [Bryobacteraceae bacterium]
MRPTSGGSVPGTVSLVVAVTGHRDLHREDFHDLEMDVGRILAGLRGEYPNTPLLMLSGLAEGADRIAVRAAKASAVPYIAVLPMPEHLYRADFETEESDSEFGQLLNGAVRRIVLPLAAGASLSDVARPGESRDVQYERLGDFLVNYSQILIAIWDRKRTRKKGGTSEVVAMKLGEKRESGRMAAGPVYELLARRVRHGAEMPIGVKFAVQYPLGSGAKDYDEIYKLLEQYNTDVVEAGPRLAAAAEKSRSDLFDGALPTGLTEAMQWVATVYSWADTLAIDFANRSLRLWKAVFALLAIGGVGLTWLHTLNGGWPMLLVYYACLGFAFLLARWELKGRRRERHEDYRALAEALRVQFFWMAAGFPDLAAEQYLRKQAGEMVWIRDAMSECGLYEEVLERSRGAGAGAPARIALVQKWVESQARYFLKTSLEHEKKRKAFNLFAKIAAAAGLLVPLLALLAPSLEHRPEPRFETWSHAVAAIAMWWAALAWNYSERRGFVEEARQYGRMYDLFHTADQDLKQLETEGTERSFERAEEIIGELGREALAENGDWLAMHRERKVKPGPGV